MSLWVQVNIKSFSKVHRCNDREKIVAGNNSVIKSLLIMDFDAAGNITRASSNIIPSQNSVKEEEGNSRYPHLSEQISMHPLCQQTSESSTSPTPSSLSSSSMSSSTCLVSSGNSGCQLSSSLGFLTPGKHEGSFTEVGRLPSTLSVEPESRVMLSHEWRRQLNCKVHDLSSRMEVQRNLLMTLTCQAGSEAASDRIFFLQVSQTLFSNFAAIS